MNEKPSPIHEPRIDAVQCLFNSYRVQKSFVNVTLFHPLNVCEFINVLIKT